MYCPYRTTISFLLITSLTLTLFMTACTSQLADSSTSSAPVESTVITVWHYYNGASLTAFDQLVHEFNNTQGSELGIIVESSAQGSVTDLTTNVLDAINKKAGSDKIPNIFASYADTAYQIDQLGILTDLTPYISEVEFSQYISGYLEEGYFSGDGSLKIFPIAKATELFVLNQTDWSTFASETNSTTEEFATFEGLTALAEKYYNWTDAQTPELKDGKAFFGRDALANYLYIGAKQLGMEYFTIKGGKTTLNFDREILHKLWDNYYIPYIKGYFTASGKFRSDDMKAGKILAYIGSSSSAAYLPNKVISEDNMEHPIQVATYAPPKFQEGDPYAIQQGAGMVVTKASEQEISASVTFLKWLTQKEQNLAFASSASYLPVTYEANKRTAILETLSTSNLSEPFIEAILTAVDVVGKNDLYYPKVFENTKSVRNIFTDSLSSRIDADCKDIALLRKNGVSYEDAIAPYLTDDTFDTWYEATKKDLEQLLP